MIDLMNVGGTKQNISHNSAEDLQKFSKNKFMKNKRGIPSRNFSRAQS